MQSSQIPTKFQTPFAINASGAYTRAVPQTTADPNAASFNVGFPPNTFVPPGSGGAPPDGRDFNGLLNAITAWNQWMQAGGAPVAYDSTFQAAIGGYPKGAIVASVLTFGSYWLSNAENNATDPDTGGAGWQPWPTAVTPAVNQVQLKYVSASTIQLAPLNGGYLWINGVNYVVPASLTLSSTGLAANTLYYVYAYMNSGTMTLEASTTGYTLAANGMAQKTGDVTRSLVGMIYTSSGAQFVWSSSQRLVLSWFNRRLVVATNSLSPGTTGSSTAPLGAEIDSTKRAYVLVWGDDEVEVSGTTSITNSGANVNQFWLNADGTTPGYGGSSSTNGGTTQACASSFNRVTGEGLHYVTVYGAVSAGTFTIVSNGFYAQTRG